MSRKLLILTFGLFSFALSIVALILPIVLIIIHRTYDLSTVTPIFLGVSAITGASYGVALSLISLIDDRAEQIAAVDEAT